MISVQDKGEFSNKILYIAYFNKLFSLPIYQHKSIQQQHCSDMGGYVLLGQTQLQDLHSCVPPYYKRNLRLAVCLYMAFAGGNLSTEKEENFLKHEE